MKDFFPTTRNAPPLNRYPQRDHRPIVPLVWTAIYGGMFAAGFAGCTSSPPGAEPLAPTRTITWFKTDTPNADCVKVGAERPLVGTIRGCSVWRRNPCEIHAPDVKAQEDRKALATLGEEIKHCFDGPFHEEQL